VIFLFSVRIVNGDIDVPLTSGRKLSVDAVSMVEKAMVAKGKIENAVKSTMREMNRVFFG
jgi:hypothetical protein